MADEIEIGSKAIKQIQDLRAELIKLSQEVLNVNKNSINISTPSGLNKSTGDNAKVGAELESLKVKYTALSDTIVKKADQSRLAEIRLQQAREKSFDKFEKNSQKESALLDKQSQAYFKLDLAHKKAVQSAQNLGAQYGVTSSQFVKASAKANILDNELKQIDATLGKSQRNVGNYKSAFNGLGGALSQLGFIGGAAGVVALGMKAFDTSKELQSLNLALQSVTETQANFIEQQSFLSRIAERYGADLKGLTAEYVSFYVSAKDKLAGSEIQGIFEDIAKSGSALGLSNDSLKRSFVALNQMLSKGTVASEELRGQLAEAMPGAVQAMVKAVQKLHPEIKDLNEKGLFEMIKAGKILANEVLPETARQLVIMTGADKAEGVITLTKLTNQLGNAWTRMITAVNNSDSSGFGKFVKGVVSGVTTILDLTGQLFQNEDQLQNTFKNIGKNQGLNEYQAIMKNISGTTKEQQEITKKALLEREREAIRVNQSIVASEKKKRESIIGGDRAFLHLQTKAEEDALVQIGKSAAIIKKIKQDEIEQDKKVVKSASEVVKTKVEKVRATKLEGVSQLSATENEQGAIERLKTLKKALEQTRDETSKNNAEFEQFNKSIEAVNKAIDVITKPLTVDLNIKTPIEDATKAIYELSEAGQQYLNSFLDDFAQGTGFTELFDVLRDNVEGFGKDFAVTFNAIAEIAQETFNFINQNSEQKFENEKTRLQNQYEISLAYAGDNKAAQEKLSEDLEKQKQKIANREAKAKQKQAIFNIAIDTAQAIVSALPNIPLSILVGAIGAVQIGLVAAQKIPQYWMGGTHDGGLMMVNDGNGSNYQETIVTPDGKIMQPTGRNVIMNTPKGTEIYTHDMWQDQLQSMMQGNGISMSVPSQSSNGMTAQQMDVILGKHFSKIALNNVSFDANGMRTWSERNGNKTILTASRVSRTGIKV